MEFYNMRAAIYTGLSSSLLILFVAVLIATTSGKSAFAGSVLPGSASSSVSPMNEGKATGSLSVKIKPKGAKQSGARWRVDDGAWQKGGKTISGLDEGNHEVSFKSVPGWKTPKNQTVSILANSQTNATGRYKSATSQTIVLPGDVPLELVWVPAGSFTMGRYADETGSNANESPQHQVTLANGYWMGKYEVTQAQWLSVMGSNPSYFTGDLNRPVERVSWDNVQSFIIALNALGQGTFRLPTESEWEYACRAGTSTRFYWGDDASLSQIASYAWYTGNSSSTTHPVGQKLPNAWGLYDMSGNVLEWCEDWFHSDYTGAPADGSAWLSPAGSTRVIRGGGWSDYAAFCRSALRYNVDPTVAYDYSGFRIIQQ